MKSALNQYYTPTWAAELLVERHFPHLCERDMVMDPTCGDGRFLLAIPDRVPAFGVDLDPEAAALAHANTGRLTLAGHFSQIALPHKPSAVVGNPPFVTKLIDDLMECCFEWLEYGGKVGLILPCYYFQASERVVRLARRWSLAQELLPRDLFEQLKHPILFATFVKARQAVISGFFLHHERDALEDLRKEAKALFVGNNARANVWRDAVQLALEACNGMATLDQLYTALENSRPTRNPWWREKVRQIAGKHFHRIEPGRYSLSQTPQPRLSP